MTKRKTAPLDGSLLARKGAAVPAQVSAPASVATTTAEKPREDPIALTVKLDTELYFRLKRLGMRTKPRRTNQEMIVEAIRDYVVQLEAQAHG